MLKVHFVLDYKLDRVSCVLDNSLDRVHFFFLNYNADRVYIDINIIIYCHRNGLPRCVKKPVLLLCSYGMCVPAWPNHVTIQTIEINVCRLIIYLIRLHRVLNA